MMERVETATTPQPNIPWLPTSLRLWIVIILTGAGSGLAGGLLMKLLRLVQHVAFDYSSGDFLRGVEQASSERRVVAVTVAGMLTAATLFAMKRLSSAGKLESSDLSLAIWTNSGRIPALSTLLHSLLSIVIVGMGAALGREGALKDTGAVVANKLSDWLTLTTQQRQLLAACGAGAGMAAAYNVPLGGALFAAEVLLGSLTLTNVLPTFVASVTGVAVSWLLLPNEPAYTFPVLHASHSLVLWSIPAGPILGLLSIVYVRVIAWAKLNKPQGLKIIALPLLVFTALAFASVKFPQLLGNGKNIVQLTFFDQIAPGLLFWLILLHPIATALCLRSGAPGGLFTPTMTFGALVGDAFGRLWNHFVPGTEVAGFALVGSAAFLAAATLAPLSSAVFLLELTRHADSIMVPLLIATAGATVTARRLEVRSIYALHASIPCPAHPTPLI